MTAPPTTAAADPDRPLVDAVRRRPATAVGAVALVVGLVVALWPGAPAGASDGAGLPPRLPGYSYLTDSASDSPPGRAVALRQQGFGVELFDFPQAVVVGASGAVRRLDVAEDRSRQADQGDPASMLLSPDGLRVAVGVGDDDAPDVLVQDLSTGAVSLFPVGGGAGTKPLAWSPDGARVVTLVTDEPVNPYSGIGSGPAGRPVVVDTSTGEATPLVADGTPDVVRAAAYSPDGRRLAVQDPDGELVVLDLDGGPARQLGTTAPLADRAAWSPDGELLATTGDCIGFVAVGSSTAPGCAEPASETTGDPAGGLAFVGWAGPRSVAVGHYDAPDGAESDPFPVRSLDLDTGAQRDLTTIPTLGANYQVSRLQVPPALLVDAATSGDRPGAPRFDHGRWTLPVRLFAAVALAALLAWATAVVVPVVGRARRRYRAHGATP